MPDESLTLGEAVKLLREHCGPPERLPTADPFELILWENVAYLATPARRREAFEELKRTVGTAPEVIMAAEPSALERITARGILKSRFAVKLRECARIALEQFGGDLEAVIRGPVDKAKRALRSFPGIGEPGAEKILLFTGQQALLAPESNGLRRTCSAWSGSRGEVLLADVRCKPSGRKRPAGGARRHARGPSPPPEAWPDVV